MKVKPLFKRYMESFLNENNFFISKNEPRTIIFRHKENPDLRIYFEIDNDVYTKTSKISAEIKRDKAILYPYPLNMFLDEPSKMDTANRDQFWYFGTEEELLGALEEQANLLEKYGFNWMNKKSDIDIDKIINEKAISRKNRYDSADNTEREILINEVRVKMKEWQDRRVKPVKWKL
ncbi:MAG TPA: hypothetical protein VHY08_14835 [Bacillota bacterium]|nr:hypothetical protein [Bacillota bacterium]